MSSTKTVEQLEAEIAQAQQRAAAHSQRQEKKLARGQAKKRLGAKMLVLLVLVILFLLAALWMVLQRTHIILAFGSLQIPGLSS